MKKFTISMLTMIISLFLFSVQGQFWTLDFETASGYTTSVTEFSDGSGDYFIRTDGSNILGVYNTPQGSNYFAAMDTDGEPPNADYLTLLADDISISGFSNLNFKVLIAEDDANDAAQDWDANTFVHISYDIDNSGTFTDLIWIEADGGTNTTPRIDTDFDGIGDGTEITDVFQEFSALIAGTGTLIDILVEFNYLDSGDEDIAIDYLQIEELSGNALPIIAGVSHTPSVDITPSTTVAVSATITDSDGTVDFVELSWGNATGSLTNPITMSNGGSGDIYTATIPAQGAVTDVFYEIYAEDDAGDNATSAEYSYTVIEAQTTTLPYMEPFNADLGQCYVKSVQGDTKEWNWNSGGYAQANGYNSGETEEDWLILPGINLDDYTNEVMDFDAWWRFGDSDATNYLKIYYSTNYPGIGDPTPSTWTELSFSSPPFDQTWTNSGAIDLSGISGTMVYIAFVYMDGPAGDGYRWWEIDNISIVESTPVNVTFSVNMADETVSANGVHIAGSFSNWWDPAAIAMTDPDNDQIYEVTLGLYPGFEYQFKYINGDAWGGVESVPLACQAVGNDNRFEVVGTTDYSLDVVCFSSCVDCGTTVNYDVTFQVDMQQVTVSGDGVYLAGTITDPQWGAGALPMTQAGTIWSTTVSLEEGSTHQYKFVNGDPNNGGDWEDIGNREIIVPSANLILEIDCFDSTDPCPVADFVMINEVDADDVLTDDMEFIELYDGGVGNTVLTGLVVVLYNGSDDASYLPVADLDGYSTNASGYFVIGNSAVPNVDYIIGNGFLQNGADAVALYIGNGTDFPDNTPVTTTNLIDAIVYDTFDADDSGLLVLLNPGEPQVNEGGRGNKDEHSNQRLPNGTGGLRNTSTYDQSIPTPGEANSSIFTEWNGLVDSNWDDAGNWTNGIPDGTMGATIPDVSVKAPYPVITGAATCMSLYMATGSGLDIASSGSLTVTGTFTNAGGNLTIKSDVSGTGSLIEGNGVYATAERYYTGNQWHLISSPVSGETANLFFGLYLQNHNESSNLYGEITDETTPLNVMQGYALWDYNVGTAAFVGPVNTGAQSMALTRTAPGGWDYGWNLVGNPYPSSIDWLAASGWTKTNVGGTMYLYTGSTWATFSIPGSGTNGGTQYVAPGQGFFVSVNDNGSTTGTLGMDNGVRVHNPTAFFKNELNDVLKLAVSTNGYTDETSIIFMDGATAGFDAQYDAHKLFSLDNNVPQIYSTANGFMAANILPDVTSVAIDVKANDGESLTIAAIETSEFEHIYLEDIYSGIVTDLNSDNYTFTYFEDIQDRFIIHFAPLAIENNLENNINVYSHQQDVYVNVPENTQGDIVVYNMMGQTVATSQIVGTSTKVTLNESAYYLVKVISNESTVTQKVFIK